MNRFGCPVAPFQWQPTQQGLRGFALPTTSPIGQGPGTGAAIGASAGASVGSIIPIVGTAIGAIAGAIGGAIAGAIGKKDPEQYSFDQANNIYKQNPAAVYAILDKYLPLAGLFDLNIKTNIPIYKRYGHMGEQKFLSDMSMLIYNAAQQGQITGNDTVQSIMQRIVQPWIDSWGYGPMQDPNAGFIQTLLMGLVADYVSGQQRNWLARGGDFPFGNLPNFALPAAPAAAAPAAVAPSPVAAVNPVGSPAAAAPAQSPNGSVLLLSQPGGQLMTNQGLWTTDGTNAYFHINPAQGGNLAAVLPSGGNAGTYGIYYLNGQTWAYNSDGRVLTWDTTNGWVPQTAAPAAPPSIAAYLPQTPAASTAAASGSFMPAIVPVGSTPVVPTTIPQVATATPSATVATTSTGQPVTQADLSALVSQLAAQGQSAQQAYTSALQTLQNNGIQSTPAVQSAVQSAVATTPAPTTSAAPTVAGVSDSSPWVIGLGIVAVLFATAHPAGPVRRRPRKR